MISLFPNTHIAFDIPLRRAMARNPTVFCLAVLFFVVGVTEATQRFYPRGINLTTHFTCESVPKNNLSCPGDIKVAVEAAASTKQIMDMTNANIDNLKAMANASCIEAVKNVSCLGFPRCKPERQYIDIDAAIAACENARRVCPKVVRDAMLNCTENKKRYEELSYEAPRYACKNIHDSTGTCPDVKYKFAQFPPWNSTDVFRKLKKSLEKIKPNVTSECYKKVKSTSCLLVGLICSADEKFAVSYLSKQSCKERLDCLPEKSYTNGTKYHPSDKACNHLPDESKGIDPRNSASFLIQTTSNVVTAIILFSGILLL